MATADVAIVGLGSTFGLRAADEELAASLRRAGASVELRWAARPRELRTFALTDLAWAAAARRVELPAARAVLFSTTTAALLWRRPGAIRFDALAADNRPGRHGLWQRGLERRRLARAPVLVPWSATALSVDVATPSVVVPVPVEPSGPPLRGADRDLAAVTYGTNPHKKGLDRVLAAWRAVRREGEELVVGGVRGADGDGVRYAGPLPADEWRALLRRARVYVTAPRREDHGLAQLEALADGCRLVTTPAPGPYAALPLARALGGVAERVEDLPVVLRAALDATGPYDGVAAVAPLRRAAVDRVVAEQLLPALLPPAGRDG